MKKCLFIAIIALGVSFSACQKDNPVPSTNESSTMMTTPPSMDNDSLDPSRTAEEMIMSGESGNPKALLTEYMVSPKFGKPNSTYYYFKVYDPSGALPLSVKFNDKAYGTITYKAMTRSGSYWVLSTKIITNGWYDWKYVYSNTQQGISSNYYQLCNTYNTFSSTSSIRWPFGADGSSWNNRYGYASQIWKGGEEGGSGNGWGEGYHTGTTEQYSDDWNRGTGSQDFGAEIRSPLDGYIVNVGTYSTSYGPSKYVAIAQTTSSGQTYRFYVGHLNTTNVSVGQYVRAGFTKIGTLGMTGASVPHAHTNLRNITNGANTSVPFYFNANGHKHSMKYFYCFCFNTYYRGSIAPSMFL